MSRPSGSDYFSLISTSGDFGKGDASESSARCVQGTVGLSVALGEYSVLQLGEVSTDTGAPEATKNTVIKVFRSPLLSTPKGVSDLRERVSTLANLWSSLDHPNVAPFNGVTFDGGSPAIILPYFPNGNVVDYLKKNSDLSQADIFRLTKDALCGIVYLHANGYTHSNVHAGNFLVTNDGHVVVSDVGLNSSIRTIGETYAISAKCRSMPRELVFPADDMIPQPTTASDIYSFACTVKEIYTLEAPFKDIKNIYNFLYKLKMGQITLEEKLAGIPTFLQGELVRCFAEDPKDRPTAEALLERFEAVGNDQF